MGNILFIRGGAIGDFILTLPAIQLARDAFPNAQIEVLGYEPVAKLAAAAGLVDRTRSIEHGPLANFFAPGSTLDPELIAYFGGFDVVVSYLYDPDGHFEGNLFRAGVETLIRGPHKVDDVTSHDPAAVQLARPLEELALFVEEAHPQLALSDSHLIGADTRSSTGPVIGLHPGSGSPRKNWSLESWADVAAQLSGELDAEFIVFTGEAEERTATEFHTLLQRRLVPFTPLDGTSLVTVGATLQHRCDLFLGHDSGISHLAAAVGVPTVLLFGPTDPGIWAPQRPTTHPIRSESGDLSQISPAQVVASAKIQLQTRG